VTVNSTNTFQLSAPVTLVTSRYADCAKIGFLLARRRATLSAIAGCAAPTWHFMHYSHAVRCDDGARWRAILQVDLEAGQYKHQTQQQPQLR